MTVLVLVAFPDPHSELHEPHELHEDTWQSITGEKNANCDFTIVFWADEEMNQGSASQKPCLICQLVVAGGVTETKRSVAQPRFVTPLPVLQSYHLSPAELQNVKSYTQRKY